MRVLLDVSAVPDQPAGAGVYTVNLARQLSSIDDVDVELAIRHGDQKRWGAIAPSAGRHPCVPDHRPARLVWEQVSAPRLARELGGDVWHGPHYTLPLRMGVPAVVTVHDMTFFDDPEWHERTKVTFFRRMIAAAVRRADVVIAVSAHTAARVEELLRPLAPVVPVSHGVDHERFRPLDRRGEAKSSDLDRLRTIGVRPPFVAFAGTLEPRKDLPTLVGAFAHVAKARPDLRLVLAGNDGWGAAAMRDAVASSGVASRILRPGYVADDLVPALFRQAEVVAYPSLVEGFGLPALEALACGAALVSTTGSAVEEVAGDAALLVTPGDVDMLTDALAAILTDTGLRDRLRDAGPKQAAGFTWAASARAHLDVYRQAA